MKHEIRVTLELIDPDENGQTLAESEILVESNEYGQLSFDGYGNLETAISDLIEEGAGNPRELRKLGLKTGHRVRLDADEDEDYIVAQVDVGTFRLIGLKTGNRWADHNPLESQELGRRV